MKAETPSCSPCEEILADSCILPIEPGEKWWGGAVAFGGQMPFGESSEFECDMRTDSRGNPAMPILLSSHGRFVRGDGPFTLRVADGSLHAEAQGISFETGHADGGLRGAFLRCRDRWFPPSGKTPDLAFFASPQYNTWIELQYNQNEDDILAYARAAKQHGFPPGVLMIDDTWQFDYGTWEFDPRRFRDPRGMCDALHAEGFKVMLWVCPFVSADSPSYRKLAKEGGLVCGPNGSPTILQWWNGLSAGLDFTHPNGVAWMMEQLERLSRDFGVDGFKLDAGDIGCWDGSNTGRFPCGARLHDPAARPQDAAERYTAIGLAFPLNEYRTGWGHAGDPLVMRLADKHHSWSDLARLVPDMAAMGLAGYPFVCPDMIGGGDYVSFIPGAPSFEQELFVRSAQIHALSPMMQFSAAPWRVLDEEHFAAVKAALAAREKYIGRFLALAGESARTGEPMLRNLEYAFPDAGYADIRDEFLMGDFLLVAPQTEKGAATRSVAIPPGRWRADDGTVVDGPATIEVATPLDRIPHFDRLA